MNRAIDRKAQGLSGLTILEVIRAIAGVELIHEGATLEAEAAILKATLIVGTLDRIHHNRREATKIRKSIQMQLRLRRIKTTSMLVV